MLSTKGIVESSPSVGEIIAHNRPSVAVIVVGLSGIQLRERLITSEVFVAKSIQLPVNSVNIKPVHFRNVA